MAYKTDSEKRRRARIASVLQRHWTSAFVLTSSNSATFVVQQAQNQIQAVPASMIQNMLTRIQNLEQMVSNLLQPKLLLDIEMVDVEDEMDIDGKHPDFVLLVDDNIVVDSPVVACIIIERSPVILRISHLEKAYRITSDYAQYVFNICLLTSEKCSRRCIVDKGEGYDLNMSLFERLVLKGFPHETLSEQHHLTASSLKENTYEVEMVLSNCTISGAARLVTGQDEMTVLTPYLGQLQKLRRALAADNDPVLNDLVKAGLMPPATANTVKHKIRLATIDNYQGEESDIITASLTRSNSNRDIGFMSAPEQLNVLLSRARDGLIMIRECRDL
ncbi:hypothetical protein BT96DRAFT_1005277 [Gymnopus androsaceus JB14]|uniref:DNA2/NAM7 helicase-like C-terminal domain-containing protein n=1 Tax=Gymnopus androsaceus JB14 TaxID=1447944 RepID=A0A6A4GPM0_9AGAR|nr:hypothetical protein BT96DRAFT_1005277 [Gymnopus androsaceus JB14]